MPKMKTNAAAKKRFTFTGTGKIKRKHAYHSHILTKKTTKQKRNLCYSGTVSAVDEAKVLKLAKGNFGSRGNVWTVAKNTVEKGLQYAYAHRQLKKRTFRSLWIMRINAAVRAQGMTYSQFIGKLNAKGIALNRKVLADLAMNEPKAFEAIVKAVK